MTGKSVGTIRVLLLGGAGQVGLAFQRAAPANWQVSAPGREALDIANADAVLGAVSAADLVVNCAAYTAVDKAESEVDAAYAANRDGPAALARACAARGTPLLHLSTDYVFDGTKVGPYVETDPVGPVSVYGASKEAGEEAVRATLPAHVILRTAWVYGPDRANFLRTMLRLGAEREELRVVADQHGCPTAAADIADALVAVGNRILDGQRDGFGTYHLCGTGATTWHGFAAEIFAQAQVRGARVPRLVAIGTADYPTPAKRPANSVLDCALLEQVFGWRAPAWQDSLARSLDVLLPA
ncbi:dTDP-4-dehydrorhamnose reductase [Nitrospirillum viridazoti]|uniref:dTDP-4-dehydrorhamnose reductase n=1 Tax=Nitrospirillum viridazoti CBAmc TaxID=1441467 RepID=A0A248JYM0_9PROT|nr:dTDP-4-dehydrorhamnose reductase [Nitrospirillum amazonense]ASG23815.1 dTDP-4-dehydrorhamnose reductase [Nitrospirillum amazonense CBAmc]TWB44770.1 dTDP-4-dehydrorhamnose reductase [Nitrospirillum amazonense]